MAQTDELVWLTQVRGKGKPDVDAGNDAGSSPVKFGRLAVSSVGRAPDR